MIQHCICSHLLLGNLGCQSQELMPDSKRMALCFNGAQRRDPNVGIFIPGLWKAQACQDFGMARIKYL